MFPIQLNTTTPAPIAEDKSAAELESTLFAGVLHAFVSSPEATGNGEFASGELEAAATESGDAPLPIRKITSEGFGQRLIAEGDLLATRIATETAAGEVFPEEMKGDADGMIHRKHPTDDAEAGAVLLQEEAPGRALRAGPGSGTVPEGPDGEIDASDAGPGDSAREGKRAGDGRHSPAGRDGGESFSEILKPEKRPQNLKQHTAAPANRDAGLESLQAFIEEGLTDARASAEGTEPPVRPAPGAGRPEHADEPVNHRPAARNPASLRAERFTAGVSGGAESRPVETLMVDAPPPPGEVFEVLTLTFEEALHAMEVENTGGVPAGQTEGFAGRAAEPAGAPQAAPEKTSMRALWLQYMRNDTARVLASRDGWNVLQIQLEDEEGSLTIKTHRAQEAIQVVAGFSDPRLQQFAASQLEKIETALASQFGSSVDFSFSTDEHSRQPAERFRPDSAPARIRGAHGGPGGDVRPATMIRSLFASREWVA